MSTTTINIEQSSSDVNSNIKDIKEGEEANIERLKHILNNPSYTIFNSDCVRKKSNLIKGINDYKFDKPTFNPNQLLDDLPIVSPKLVKLLNTIDELDKADMKNHGKLFKHFIFSDLKGLQGAKIITSALIAKGMHLAYGASLGSNDKMNGGENSDSETESEVTTKVKYGKINLASGETLLKTRYNNFYLLSSVDVFNQSFIFITLSNLI